MQPALYIHYICGMKTKSKLLKLSPLLAQALELAADAHETDQCSIIRQGLISYLRRLGDDQIDTLLDQLKNPEPISEDHSDV